MKLLRPLAALSLVGVAAATPPLPYPAVTLGRTLNFPTDHGAHLDFRTEWWYVTGALQDAGGKPLGFQVTFFRTRPLVADNPSAFAAKQIVFAYVALSDPRTGRILHDERAARAGFGIAGAKLGDTDVNLRDWRLSRTPDGRFITRIVTKAFTLDLTFAPTQPILLQGQSGFSRKGPGAGDASYYYSLPQMSVSGRVLRGASVKRVTGKAWFDHEWSSSYLNPAAVGWDWTGLNFTDGSALMAFRMRRKDGTTLWTGGSFRRAGAPAITLGGNDVRFDTSRRWTSPHTGASYPVSQALTVRLPGGTRTFVLTPAMADQELDSRRSGLPVYWEGLVTTPGGSGYLELTGYTAPMKM